MKETIIKTAYRETFKVAYGWRCFIGNSDSYWSVTGTNGYSSGPIHSDIIHYFPELQPCIKWHLCAAESGPMHYIANAKFWWQMLHGEKEKQFQDKPLESFKHTTIFGVLPIDHESIISNANWNDVKVWLEGRLPKLIKLMHEECNQALALTF